jgi:hypothetical protein
VELQVQRRVQLLVQLLVQLRVELWLQLRVELWVQLQVQLLLALPLERPGVPRPSLGDQLALLLVRLASLWELLLERQLQVVPRV